ncbi:MAG: universal stress protein [Anaerolineales bacterium]
MKILYFIPNQEVSPVTIRYAAKVATRMGVNVHVLAVSNDPEKLERAAATLASAKHEFGDKTVTSEFISGDPITALQAELKRDTYTLLLMRVNRRRHLIPSRFRFMFHRIMRQSGVPVLMVRQASQKLDHMLVCTGGMQISEPVVALSARLAGQAGMTASLLTVSAAVPSMYTGIKGMEETIEEVLKTDTPMAQHLRRSAELLTDHGIDADIKIRHGDVVEAILEEAVQGKYDLIVLGFSEGWTLRGLMLGNVTQQIINRAPCAVLVVKQPDQQ